MRTVCFPTRWLLALLIALTGGLSLEAQEEDLSPDTIILPIVWVQAKSPVHPLTPEERRAYWRRVRDVKKTLPYAKYVATTIIETYEYIETLPEDEQRAHIKRVERDLKADMEPKMRQLTLSQGKVLIKLINRQSGSTGYELVKAFLGGWKAWWWNQFAKFTGANLKSDYRPQDDPDDALTERIVRLVEVGFL